MFTADYALRLIKIGAAVFLVCVVMMMIYTFWPEEDHRITYDKEGGYLPVWSLKDLALAMHGYHEKHGRLPPSAVYSKEGVPLLSWRVLLLPHLEQQELFHQFKLNEPWDSPHNLQQLPKMPRVFFCMDTRPPLEPYTTLFQVFVGKGTAFEGREGLQFRKDFPRTSYTILIVEASQSVPWSKPEDIMYAENQPLPKLGSFFKGRLHVAMVDGSVHTVRQDMNEEKIRAAINRHGNGTWPDER